MGGRRLGSGTRRFRFGTARGAGPAERPAGLRRRDDHSGAIRISQRTFLRTPRPHDDRGIGQRRGQDGFLCRELTSGSTSPHAIGLDLADVAPCDFTALQVRSLVPAGSRERYGRFRTRPLIRAIDVAYLARGLRQSVGRGNFLREWRSLRASRLESVDEYSMSELSMDASDNAVEVPLTRSDRLHADRPAAAP